VKAISFDDLIHVIWTLIATEETGQMNPLIPRLYERLHEFKRPEKPLTREEMLQLHQINIYAQDQVRVNKWPKEYKDVIPRKVREACEEEYAQFDKSTQHSDVQLDVAKKLLKLRSTFQENAKMSKSFRVDFKLADVSKVVLVKGAEQVNPRTGEWLGFPGIKHKFLQSRLTGWELLVIDADKWKETSEEQQYAFLFELSRAQSQKAETFEETVEFAE